MLILTTIDEALLILQEECVEVAYVANKAIRFGLNDMHPETFKINREVLEKEVGHILAMVYVLTAQGVLRVDKIEEGKLHKLEKLRRWSTVYATEPIL